MKNPYVEKNIKAAKIFANKWKNTHRLTERGNYLPHSYTGERVLSWWDEVLFPLGSQLVIVNWTHPRMKYRDEVESAAYDEMLRRKPLPDYNLFEKSTPIYKKVGKGSRKRIIYWKFPAPNDNTEWNKEWRELKNQMLEKSDIVIRPSMTVKQTNRGRVVDICLPIEVVDQKSIEDVASYVKGVLCGVVSFQSCYRDGYSYGCADWVKDVEILNHRSDSQCPVIL